MSRYVFDIEGDNLLPKLKTVWVICLYNLDTNEETHYLGHETDKWMPVLSSATLLVGHNICGYDIPALEKIFKWKPTATTRIHDTFVLSSVLNYNRRQGHSLAGWGEAMGYPKIEFSEFDKYSEEMLTYCQRDVSLNVRVYKSLVRELSEGLARVKEPDRLKWYIRAEQAVSRWCALAEMYGWPFNRDYAVTLFDKMEKELEATRAKITPLLGMKTVAVDKVKGEVPPKYPKWLKSGCYDAHTANWFDIDPWSGFEGEERLIEGPYSRVKFVDLDLDSINDVKIFLFRNDWKPTEWNYKTVLNERGRSTKVKMSPKITEDSLEAMQGNGKIYCEFLTTKSRHSILKGWLENCDENNRVHGSCFTIGTPSMRARHSGIVNVPSADSPWGKEMRSLFCTIPGWKLIGCDSAGNQARGLAHYLKSDEFTKQLLEGDIHQFNADVLTAILKEMGIDYTVPRSAAKRILYAFLFGASGEKLWSYIFDTLDKKQGTKLKAGFIEAVPGFAKLVEKLENVYGATSKFGDGYIYGIAGNRIYCDSFHKLLVYLLQACEKATCSAAVMLTMDRLEAAGIPYQPCIMMHDEEDFLVPEEYADAAAAIGKTAFKEGPELFGITIMDGDAKIGDNWYEVH
jgi:DNA polymerase-1